MDTRCVSTLIEAHVLQKTDVMLSSTAV